MDVSERSNMGVGFCIFLGGFGITIGKDASFMRVLCAGMCVGGAAGFLEGRVTFSFGEDCLLELIV